MRKSMFAALLVLIMLLGGCSDVSTAPTRNDENELVTETEVAAEVESTKSIYSSESNERNAPETGAALETAAEVTEREPVQSETVKQTEPIKQIEAETPVTKPTTENNNPQPAETPTQTTSENTKTAYNGDCCISHYDICRMLFDERPSCPRNRFIGIWSCGSFRHLLCRSKN